MADTDFRVKNGLVTGTNNVTIGTTLYSVANGNVGVGTAVPGFKLAITGTLNATQAITQGGNQVLHAANFNTYTPTLTGNGASGTWGINVTGTANSVIGNMRGNINGDIRWNTGANILINGDSTFDLESGGVVGFYDTARSNYALRINYNEHVRMVEGGGNVYVYGSRLYNDSGQQAVFNNSGNWSVYAYNIWQYPLNQSVLTTASPTFAGLTTTGATSVITGSSPMLTLQAPSAGPWAISLSRSDLGTNSKVYNDNGSRWNFEHRPVFAGNIPLDSANYNSYAVARTSTNRNGVTRLFRRDDDSGYSIQTGWGLDRSGYWSLRGYDSADNFHAHCWVGWAASADNIAGSYTMNQSLNTSNSPTFSSLYTQVFYDSNNTGRYCDPNGTSLLEDCRASIFYDVYDTAYYVQPRSTSYLNDLRPNIIYDRQDSYYYVDPNSSSRMYYLEMVNYFYCRNQIYSTIMYDTNDTGYFVDPNSDSRMNQIRASVIYSYGNVTAYYSDARLKNNVKPITNALTKLKSIRGVEFDWNDDYFNKVSKFASGLVKKHDVGVIAQEVKEVLPEVVVENEEGILSVKYEKIIALLIESIKDLSNEVEQLKQNLK